VGKTQKVERFWLPFPSVCSIFRRIAPKLNQAGFLILQFQIEPLQPFSQFFFEQLCFGSMLKAHYKVSGPREFHPRALSEPDMNLSAHPAPIIQP
jgi:hypothetical protein